MINIKQSEYASHPADGGFVDGVSPSTTRDCPTRPSSPLPPATSKRLTTMEKARLRRWLTGASGMAELLNKYTSVHGWVKDAVRLLPSVAQAFSLQPAHKRRRTGQSPSDGEP